MVWCCVVFIFHALCEFSNMSMRFVHSVPEYLMRGNITACQDSHKIPTSHRSHSVQIEVKSKSICVRSIAFSVCRFADATEYYCCLCIVIIIECAECTSITFDRCVWPSAKVYGAAFCIFTIICRISFVNWEKFRSKLMVNVRKSFELCGRF